MVLLFVNMDEKNIGARTVELDYVCIKNARIFVLNVLLTHFVNMLDQSIFV